jgi:hypothetical protein
MIGLSGLVWTSRTGAKSTSKPSAASSSPMARPTCSASARGVGRVEAVELHHRRPQGRRRAHPLDPAALVIDTGEQGRPIGSDRGVQRPVELGDRAQIGDLAADRGLRQALALDPPGRRLGAEAGLMPGRRRRWHRLPAQAQVALEQHRGADGAVGHQPVKLGRGLGAVKPQPQKLADIVAEVVCGSPPQCSRFDQLGVTGVSP